MILRMTLKLLLKITIPLAIVIGSMNYSMYLRGGDPVGMWKRVGENMVVSTKERASDAVAAIGDLYDDLTETAAPSKPSTIYGWRDADGVMQYSQEKPVGLDAVASVYDTDANVMDAVKRVKKPASRTASVSTANTPNRAALSAKQGGLQMPESGLLSQGEMSEQLGLDQLDSILKARQQQLEQF